MSFHLGKNEGDLKLYFFDKFVHENSLDTGKWYHTEKLCGSIDFTGGFIMIIHSIQITNNETIIKHNEQILKSIDVCACKSRFGEMAELAKQPYLLFFNPRPVTFFIIQ